MSEKLASKLVNLAIGYGVVKEDDEELYLYSYQITIEFVFSWASILILSVFLHTFLGTLFFMAFYIPLRLYAGGYHAKSFSGCYFLSIATYLVFCFIEPYVSAYLPIYALIGIVLCLSAVIAYLAPIEDPNKPMELADMKRCEKRARVILFLQVVVIIIMALTPWGKRMVYFPSFSILIMCLSLVVVRKNRQPHS